MKECGIQVLNDGVTVGLCLTKSPEGFTRSRNTEVICLTKAEAESLAIELTLNARKVIA